MKKKRVFASLLLSALFLSCSDNDTFTGYIVAKEYTPEHMSNESEKTISYAALIIVHPHFSVSHRPRPQKIYEKWVWYIANKHQVICKQVSKKVFDTRKCGDKVAVKY